MKVRYCRQQRGASIVHWLIAIVPLMGFGALAIDFNNLYVSLGELQNASDAGSLEGARLLYLDDGSINVGQDIAIPAAVVSATSTAQANDSQGEAVEVISVNRGHWEFRTSEVDTLGIERGGAFSGNPTTTPADLLDADGNFRTFQDLNLDPGEINAVEVVTARQTTPVQSFLGQLLGIDDYQTYARSVAYVGFAGTILPGEVDIPIAMCEEILTEGCTVGRLVPSPDQTGGWTNLNQPDGSCTGATSSSELQSLVGTACADGDPTLNPQPIILGKDMQVNNGQVEAAFSDLYDCWKATEPTEDGWPIQPVIWNMPVVAGCRFGGSCAPPIGAVRVEVLWMFDNNPMTSGAHSLDNTAPRKMGDWNADHLADPNDGEARWNDFVGHYQLSMDTDGTPAIVANGGAIQKTMYFKPSCDPVELGNTGGANYGVRAKVPVLVR